MKVYIKKNKEEIDNEVANLFLEKVKNKSNAILGLATGSTPIGIYKNIIAKSKDENISFKDVTTFNLDEYVGLKADNEMSYRYFMNENLFKHLDFKSENHYFPLIESYKEYDALIESKGGIDIQILGIGANGHIAFNEPGTDINSLTHVTKLALKTIQDNSRFFNSIDEVPKEAITMGLKSILNAKTIVLVALGKNKAEAVKALLSGNYDPNYPASALNLKNDDVFIYLDEDAASLL